MSFLRPQLLFAALLTLVVVSTYAQTADARSDDVLWLNGVPSTHQDVRNAVILIIRDNITPTVLVVGGYKTFIASNAIKIDDIEQFLVRHGVQPGAVARIAPAAYRTIRSAPIRTGGVLAAVTGGVWFAWDYIGQRLINLFGSSPGHLRSSEALSLALPNDLIDILMNIDEDAINTVMNEVYRCYALLYSSRPADLDTFLRHCHEFGAGMLRQSVLVRRWLAARPQRHASQER